MQLASIKIKRVYEAASRKDGFRILVDRVWPRGVSKEKARVDLWLKEVGPSTALRKWFGHDPRKWGGFKKRYFAELDARPPGLETLVGHVRGEPVTLVFSARDPEHNQALALKEYLEAVLGGKAGQSPKGT